MGNLFEVNGLDVDEEIKALFPNTTEGLLDNNNYAKTDNDVLVLDFNNPLVKELMQQGRGDEILSMCAEIIGLKPNNEIAWLNKGNCLMKLKRYSEAIKHLEIVIEKRGDLIEAYYSIIECQYRLHQYNDGIKIFDALTIRIPNNEVIRLKKGLFLNEINKRELAIEEFDKAIEINPFYSIAYYCKGNCLVELKQRQEALASFNKAIELDKTNLNYLLRKAILLQESEEYKQSRDVKLQMEDIINSSLFDSKKYNIKKITDAMKMIDVMSNLISINEEKELELIRKIYQGDISSFYEGIYIDKPAGVKVFPYKENIFDDIIKHCELFNITCSNKNVITIYKCEEDIKENKIRIIGEYYEGSNLMKYFQRNTPPLQTRIDIIKQIGNGMQFLIQNNIFDFQLNLRKILLDKNNRIRLCDIGIKAFFKDKDKEQKEKNAVNELRLVMCEILKKPSVILSNISLITLEKCLIKTVPANIIHLMIQMFHEDMEKNGIIYYINYLINVK